MVSTVDCGTSPNQQTIMGNVVISPNIKKTSERIDPQGNIINPRTKQIIQQNTLEYVPTPQAMAQAIAPEVPQAPITSHISKDDGMSVLQQIQATKQRLAELEELKKLKISEKEAELELLKQ